jgi:5-methyltetrahydrofolate--homocysteine methyltransferase
LKIQPHYDHGVIHVLDASRSVNVVSSLLNPERKLDYLAGVDAEYQGLRTEYAGRSGTRALLSFDEARANPFTCDWQAADIPVPASLGVKEFDNFPLDELAEYFDWSPFFHAWELRGRFPAIFDDPVVGVEARKLYDDARHLLDDIVRNRLFRARGVFGFWTANRIGEDIQLYSDVDGTTPVAVFHALRQQMKKPPGQPNFSLADFVAPRECGRIDHVGAFAVTAGEEVHEVAADFERRHDDYLSIMTKALGDRFAEAFAECLHQKARELWGFGTTETLTREDLIREKYRGIRPAPGYPAQPDHTEKLTIWQLLDVERRTGIMLTENLAMYPGSSVSGLYFAHPDARYFGVGKIERDQVHDYAARKGLAVAETERWLQPILNYDANRESAAGFAQ